MQRNIRSPNQTTSDAEAKVYKGDTCFVHVHNTMAHLRNPAEVYHLGDHRHAYQKNVNIMRFWPPDQTKQVLLHLAPL